MENLGSLAVLLAFCVALYALVASVAGRIKNKPFLILSGERAVYSVWGLVTLASGILVYAMLTGDFRFAYVAAHSNRSMPLLYKFVVSPFQMLAVDKLITAVPDGNGLNPLLQYPAMAIHPPMLYLGYVGFAVPFAFAV